MLAQLFSHRWLHFRLDRLLFEIPCASDYMTRRSATMKLISRCHYSAWQRSLLSLTIGDLAVDIERGIHAVKLSHRPTIGYLKRRRRNAGAMLR